MEFGEQTGHQQAHYSTVRQILGNVLGCETNCMTLDQLRDTAAFRDAGIALAALHLGYETGLLYPLDVEVTSDGSQVCQLGPNSMQWGGTHKKSDKSMLKVTDHVTLRGIPAEAHGYVVNGRTPLEWTMDRLHIRQDRESGIVNDPTAWFAADPPSLISHLQRLVHVSVETHRIVKRLPSAL